MRFAIAIWLVAIPGVAAADAPLADRGDSIIALVAKVTPTVVAIHTWRVIPPDDPSKASLAPKVERAEGSGFIVSPDGFIATNKHVVDGAYDVTVVLHEGGTAQASIIWESPVVDVAFLKIKTDHPLQAATLAHEYPKIGERVIAIGNPVGLGISTSAGIVSALDRNLKQSPYDRFIQTDAAINNGNSGGPLFNIDGDVVGMNSVSWTTAKDGGSIGLGFAMPGDELTFLIDQLKRNGHIVCGMLGVHGQKLTATISDALGFPDHNGVLVASIEKGSSAAQAGLHLGDIITTFDNTKLYDVPNFNHAVCLAVDRPVSMQVWRSGQFLDLKAQMIMSESLPNGVDGQYNAKAPRFANANDLGMKLLPIDGQTRRKYKLDAGAMGLVVASVSDSSEAENRGLSPGDVITSLQMTPLPTSESFDDTFAQCGKAGQRNVIILVRTGGGERWVTLPVNVKASP